MDYVVKRAGDGCDTCSQHFAATCVAMHQRTSVTEVRVSAWRQAVLCHCRRSPVHRYCSPGPPIYWSSVAYHLVRCWAGTNGVRINMPHRLSVVWGYGLCSLSGIGSSLSGGKEFLKLIV